MMLPSELGSQRMAAAGRAPSSEGSSAASSSIEVRVAILYHVTLISLLLLAVVMFSVAAALWLPSSEDRAEWQLLARYAALKGVRKCGLWSQMTGGSTSVS